MEYERSVSFGLSYLFFSHKNSRYVGNSVSLDLSREAARATLVAVVFVLELSGK